MKIESLVIDHYDNGKVFLKGQRNSKGQREGLWEWFYPSGNIEMRTPYKGGKEHGIEEMFYQNGNIYTRITYREGERDGIVECFDKQGNITRTIVWKDGQLIKTTEH